MNFCLERHKLSLTLLMLIIFYGTLDLVGWSSSLYLNNDISAHSAFPPHTFYHLSSGGAACRALCLWLAWISLLKNVIFLFQVQFGRVPVCSTIQFVFPAATTAVGAELGGQTSPNLLPKPSLGTIYRSFSWKHQHQTLTILFSCFTFVLLSQNKFILNGMFSF